MFALLYANGGKETTKGSLMEKYGVNLALHREDSNSQMKADLLACAKQLHDGEKTCSSGAVALVVMGDGGGQWLADLNPQLKKLGPEYQAVIIGAVGRSNGEDALLGPAEWKSNPQSMKGKTVVGVIRDGDWNIALNYMGSNGAQEQPGPEHLRSGCGELDLGAGRRLHQGRNRGVRSQSLRRSQGGEGRPSDG